MATILIVDDDKFTRNVLETIFSQDQAFAELDLTILTAGDGEEGMELFREHSPEVVITDLLMPKVDGFEVCRSVRGEPNGAAVALFVASGVYRDASIGQRLKSDYGAKFFAKPYQIRDLTQAVAQVLTAQSGFPVEVHQEQTTEYSRLAPAGQLGETPLPQVLLNLLEARATGRLTLKRGRTTKHIDLVLGHPVAVTSNLREETLGYFLVSRGVITDDIHQRALEQAASSNRKLGEILMEFNAITSERLVELLALQTRHKIIRALRWPDGEWAFHDGTEPSESGQPLDSELLVLQGLRQTASAADAYRRVTGMRGRRLSLTPRGKRLWPRIPRVLGEQFGALWSDGCTVGTLIRDDAHRVEVSVALDCLQLCDALQVDDLGEDTSTSTFVQLDHTGDDLLSVTELSQQSLRFRDVAPPEDESDEGLYSMLFGEGLENTRTGAYPLEVDDEAEQGVPAPHDSPESGVIDVHELNLAITSSGGTRGEGGQARRLVIDEYLRVQNSDHYEVLQVPRTATAEEISGAVVERQRKFALEFFARFDLGRDHTKLEELHRRYAAARAQLLDDKRRRAYDQELAGGELGPSAPSLDAEIAFRGATTLMTRDDYSGAISRLTQATKLSPEEPDYHAALGWAHFMRGEQGAHAADAARIHLNRALQLNPHHPRGHEYKGLICAAIGADDVEVIGHLERALEGDPTREFVLDALGEAWRRRGELRPLERIYRHAIHRCAGGNHPVTVERGLWVRLAALYRELGELDNSRVAYESALRLAPEDSAIKAALADVASGVAADDGFFERSDALRSHWHKDPTSPGPGTDLFQVALTAGRFDAAFLVASVLEARGQADAAAEQYYQRYRPRFVVRAQCWLDEQLWEHLRHEEDDPNTGILIDLLGPAIDQVAPIVADDLEIDEQTLVPARELPAGFRRIRSYIANVLCVPEPEVHVRTDFGHQIHVGALGTPVLLAGDEALAAPERLELAFRLGRAMTYLRPGRAIGASRPARQLKAAMLGALASAIPSTEFDDRDDIAVGVRAALDDYPAEQRARVHSMVKSIAGRSRTINLSAWARSLTRSADRAGMVLCGDIPASARFIRDSSPTADALEDLLNFAIGIDHFHLRSCMGLTVHV